LFADDERQQEIDFNRGKELFVIFEEPRGFAGGNGQRLRRTQSSQMSSMFRRKR
jgi:hypothetical protein